MGQTKLFIQWRGIIIIIIIISYLKSYGYVKIIYIP